ncbi:hypothetical protein L2E82_17992 [Cichorium intybus]|uniref:Uncharacterized protein n=1 Tax=Cichorium intybus TaxID=13427 RepID=A0ACB9FA13_CICIN|nr:hypothetical protein L2E82_17992 [Cichorium intybus]
MGKAGKWIKSLLLGKKDDKIAKKDGTTTSPPCTTAIIPATPSPSHKRRWSFRRSNNTEIVVNHKSCRSFDSIITSQLVSQALFDYAIQQQNRNTMLVVPPRKAATYGVPRVVVIAAATRIQAAFRSYLARKALSALRGLVKLQALVRGHLVRKRTTTMVRCMKALVSIQVRARYHRIQMAEDVESRSHLCATSRREFVIAHERRLSAPQFDHDNSGQFESKTSGFITYRQSSRRFSIDSLPWTHENSPRLQNKPINKTSAVSQTGPHHDDPNYMTRTKSSRAKARSQSEPRQRPTKQKRENRKNSSNEGLGSKVVRTHNHQKDHSGYSTKIHQSSNSINDIDFDSRSTCTNGSSYWTTQISNLY